MIIQLEPNIKAEHLQQLEERLDAIRYSTTRVTTQFADYIIGVGKAEIDLGDGIQLGTGHFGVMAGPCSIESEEQIEKTITHLQQEGVRIMRGGVYKPRSSPYSFRGLGIDGLKMWYKRTREAGIKIITEVMMVEQIEAMADYVDVFQVGARNSQNFNLLAL